MSSYSLIDINGFGTAKAELLRAHGIDTPAYLANASFDDIVAFPCFSNALAQRLRQAARRLAKAAERERPEPVFTDASSLTAAPTNEAKPAKTASKAKKDKPKKDKHAKKDKKKPKKDKADKKDKGQKEKSKKDKHATKDKKKPKKDKNKKDKGKKSKSEKQDKSSKKKKSKKK